ncbi:MAG TPA: hypothetical protein DIW23_04950 [Anaerolineae bacterium]|nr:hypothetical protein [Anaerolineae bacterium]
MNYSYLIIYNPQNLKGATYMLKQTRISLFALITLLILLANLIFPTSALADDETPTPAATEETTLPEETEADTESQDSIDESVEDTQSQDPTEDTPPQEPTSEPAPVSETLEQLPENTDLIILDENGEPLPLVTEEAEEAIIIGDPVWCPATLSAPTPGANGCTSSYVSFQDLITYLDANEQAMDGTIWIESSYNSSVNDAASSGFVFSGGTFTTMRDYALTIQGGWNGVSGSSSIGSASIFSGDYLVVANWNANVTINDIAMNGTSGSHGITVVTNGAVNLSDVSVQNSNLSGVYIDNRGGTEDVTISGTNNFSDNNNAGLLVFSRGDISTSGVTANNNTIESGAILDNASGSGNVSVSNSTFNGNGSNTDAHGIWVQSNGNVTLNYITANNNYYAGASVGNYNTDNFIGGNVFISNSTFNQNGLVSDWDGLDVFALGDVEINNVTANENGYTGFWIGDSDNGTPNGGSVHIQNSTTNDNDYDGISVDTTGEILLKNVISNNNIGNDGISLYNSNGTSEIIIINSQFNNNGDEGVDAYSAGSITLNNVIANGNLDDGADLENCGCAGTVGINIFNSAFNNNGEIGVVFYSDGAVIIENTTVNNNGLGGIGGDAFGNIIVKNVVAIGNPHGLGFFSIGDVTVQCSTITNNSIDGVGVDANNLNLIGSTITNNGVDYFNSFGAVNIFDYNCNPTSGKKPAGGTGLPLNIVQGNSADLDCDLYSGTTLILPNGDKVTFKCPIGDSATLNNVANDNLPNALPEDVEYVSGLVATTSPDGSDVPLDGLVVVTFIIPDGMQGEDFAILYWDGTEWLDLDTATFEDGRKVFNGGYITEDGYFEALTNFSGNFVLVKK